MKSIALLALCCLLVACETLGLATPKDVPDRIAYVTTGADAVVVAATNALTAHTISSADAQFVSTSGHQLSLLAAAAGADPDPTSAEGRLALAEGVLKQLQTYVATHKRGLQP